ncbi:hypothetical protein ECDEC6C_2252 [Escherichia coli DEC6C]|nr:hypothetical protein ECDEC6C_2252 [Escherichia coli DEC6C]
MGQFSTNSYVNERKQPKNGLNNCPTNNGANDTENNEKPVPGKLLNILTLL